MRPCYECGASLGDEWPAGICSKCLLEQEPSEAGQADCLVETLAASDTEVSSSGAREDFARRYDFLDDKPISRGGQGEVFRVRDGRLHREIALKRLPDASASEASAESRFWAEAQIAGQLKHPGFLPIFDLGLDSEGRPFYTTVLLSGRTFGDVIREVHRGHEGPDLAVRRALEQVLQICNAMAYAHSIGIVHRDLKPTNIMIGEYGEVFVIDLGSASVAGTGYSESTVSPASQKIDTDRAVALEMMPDSPEATANAGIPGTLVYMAPELLKDPVRKPEAKMDIYALGVVLYELVTGRLPYSRPDRSLPDWRVLKEQILRGPPTPVRQIRRSVSRDLAAICEKTMARDPADRYASSRELGEDIRALLETRVVEASRPGPVARLQKWALRHSRHLAVAALVLGFIGTVTGVGYSLKIQRDHARQTNHLRDAQIAARNGQWRAALDHLGQAEAAGYTNLVDLGLQRIEALRAVGENELIRSELTKLQRLPDLGSYRGTVLMRLAELELLDQATYEAGLDHVRQALAAGLNWADEAVARGFLAETTPEALEHFQRALDFNPQHYQALTYSIGLELFLGQPERIDSQVALLKMLYPDDPGPTVIQAFRLALDGRVAEAEKEAASLGAVVGEENHQKFMSVLRLVGDAVQHLDLENCLKTDQLAPLKTNEFTAAGLALFIDQQPASPSNQLKIRMLIFPSVKHAYLELFRAIVSLAMPLSGRPDAALEKIRAACRINPDGLLPLAAAKALEPHRPTDPLKVREYLTTQSELLQMAAQRPSLIPKVHRLARFMAALAQVELIQNFKPPSSDARRAAVTNLRWFLGAERTSAVEYQACSKLAYSIGEYDLARELLSRCEVLKPSDSEVIQDRIRLELASEAYPKALHLVDRLLAESPTNQWALDMRKNLVLRIKGLTESVKTTVQPSK
jgi:serine/threonine protein kinase